MFDDGDVIQLAGGAVGDRCAVEILQRIAACNEGVKRSGIGAAAVIEAGQFLEGAAGQRDCADLNVRFTEGTAGDGQRAAGRVDIGDAAVHGERTSGQIQRPGVSFVIGAAVNGHGTAIDKNAMAMLGRIGTCRIDPAASDGVGERQAAVGGAFNGTIQILCAGDGVTAQIQRERARADDHSLVQRHVAQQRDGGGIHARERVGERFKVFPVVPPGDIKLLSAGGAHAGVFVIVGVRARNAADGAHAVFTAPIVIGAGVAAGAMPLFVIGVRVLNHGDRRFDRGHIAVDDNVVRALVSEQFILRQKVDGENAGILRVHAVHDGAFCQDDMGEVGLDRQRDDVEQGSGRCFQRTVADRDAVDQPLAAQGDVGAVSQRQLAHGVTVGVERESTFFRYIVAFGGSVPQQADGDGILRRCARRFQRTGQRGVVAGAFAHVERLQRATAFGADRLIIRRDLVRRMGHDVEASDTDAYAGVLLLENIRDFPRRVYRHRILGEHIRQVPSGSNLADMKALCTDRIGRAQGEGASLHIQFAELPPVLTRAIGAADDRYLGSVDNQGGGCSTYREDGGRFFEMKTIGADVQREYAPGQRHDVVIVGKSGCGRFQKSDGAAVILPRFRQGIPNLFIAFNCPVRLDELGIIGDSRRGGGQRCRGQHGEQHQHAEQCAE